MENVKKISDSLSVAPDQPSPEQFQQAAREGYRAILNLRSPDEEGFLSDERQQVESTGLQYAHIPVKPEDLSDELADRVLQTIDDLPRPTLIHCKSGLRSGAMALMYVATGQGMTADEALAMAKQQGFNCDAHPQMKQFFERYVVTHTRQSAAS